MNEQQVRKICRQEIKRHDDRIVKKIFKSENQKDSDDLSII